jgi:hypothetical protein
MILALVSAAHAEERTEPARWYGWQTLAVDGLSVSAVGVGLAFRDEHPVGYLALGSGLAGYVLAAPIVHFAHGRTTPAFASLALRVGAPTVGVLSGGLIGYGVGCAVDCNGDFGAEGGMLVGALAGGVAGAVSAMVVDAVVFAREPAATTAQVHWMPTSSYDPKRQAATFGVTGSF